MYFLPFLSLIILNNILLKSFALLEVMLYPALDSSIMSTKSLLRSTAAITGILYSKYERTLEGKLGIENL